MSHKNASRTRKNTDIAESLKSEFGVDGVVFGNDLYAFMKRNEPDLQLKAFRARVGNLVKHGILMNAARNMYVITAKPAFSPNLDQGLTRLYGSLGKKFPGMLFCVWSTSFLFEFMEMLPTKRWDFVEVEKDAVFAVFRMLQTGPSRRRVMFDPTAREMELYLPTETHVIIVRTLVSQSPVMTMQNIRLPMIEKILVDLTIDSIFKPFSGNTLRTIWSRVFESYAVNLSALSRYASRRTQLQPIIELMKTTDLPSYARTWIEEIRH